LNIVLPHYILHAINCLNNAGYEAFAVGGCIRDSLIGRTPTDWDITTSAHPHQILEVFRDFQCLDYGMSHGTITVVIQDSPIEITTYRVDGAYSDGRHPDSVTFTGVLTEDLKRRDFTVNAMAYHPALGLMDPFNGQDDLIHRVLRCVGNPDERFAEDALRILRCFRFASVLGFAIDSATDNAANALSHTLAVVSVERITCEFLKLLCGQNAATVLMEHRNIIEVFLPEIRHLTASATLSVVRPFPAPRLAALFFSACVDPQGATAALQRLRVDNQTIADVGLLLSALYTDQRHSDEEYWILSLLNRLGPSLTLDFLTIKEYGHTVIEHVNDLIDRNVCYCVSMLNINGNDLISIGVPRGPAVGEMLQSLLIAVMSKTCPNEKEALLSYAKTKSPC
jgi:tRNA nucleotidyltransferase (CCA-adding enzyme)